MSSLCMECLNIHGTANNSTNDNVLQACFVKDRRTPFAYYCNFIFSRLYFFSVKIEMVKELSHFFRPSALEYTFGRHQV